MANQTKPAGDSASRLGTLRAELKCLGLDGFIVPRNDAHMGEYVPPSAERLLWLTGFSGSAGQAVVLADKAALFVDGRYTLQAATQVDGDLFQPVHISKVSPNDWIADNLGEGGRLGYDPWLLTPAMVRRLAKACKQAGGEFVPIDTNPIDTVWTDRPTPPLAPVIAHPMEYSGRESADKRRQLGDDMSAGKIDATVLSAPDSIAWLLNVRGGDVDFAPLPLVFAILYKNGSVDLFMDREKISAGLGKHLGDGIAIRQPADLGPALDRLGMESKRVAIDPAATPAWIADRLTAAGADMVEQDDPCQLPKAIKNDTELDGMRAAHRRDGAALTRFLAWLDSEAPSGKVTEISATEKLEELRRESTLFRGPSFPTISGAGAHGAIVHYRADEKTNATLMAGSLYLVDSGGQYPDGTTDVTRTIAIGPPSDEMRDRFTRVLKGHIALASAQFPDGTAGPQLDILARQALWQQSLDYDHGTGHGVGSYLNVHEGPARISKSGGGAALEPGMVLSNEPGFYKEGAYGIRIENLVAVRGTGGSPETGQKMNEFETLTLAPFDRNLIDISLLDPDERQWVDAYHGRVYEVISPLVDGLTHDWLKIATRPLLTEK